MSSQIAQSEAKDAVVARLSAFARSAKANARAWSKAATIGGRFRASADLADLRAVRKGAAALGKLGLTEVAALVDELQSYADNEAQARSFRLVREVTQALADIGVETRPVGTEPPTFRAGALVVALDTKKEKAVISYARQTVTETSLSGEAVGKAHREATASLEKACHAPPAFHELLVGAYRAHLARHGGEFGQRVDAVELLPEVAVAVQGDKFRTDPRRKLFTDYSRAQFAYDLTQLIGAGLTAHNGVRLEMGPATMGATANKRRVLWLEVGPTEGQYFLSLRFTTMAGRSP